MWFWHSVKCLKKKWATSWQNQQNGMCTQRRLRSAWVKKAWVLSYPLSAQRRLLIRLGGYPGWSASSLAAPAILLVLSWGGSIMKRCRHMANSVYPVRSDSLLWVYTLHCLPQHVSEYLGSSQVATPDYQMRQLLIFTLVVFQLCRVFLFLCRF